MNEGEELNVEIDAPPARVSRGSWWKPQTRTIIIAVFAIVSIGLLAMLVFAGRDSSGDAAGQGLAGAFEAAFFVLGAGLIAMVALATWLTRYVRWPMVVMIVFGVASVAIIALIR